MPISDAFLEGFTSYIRSDQVPDILGKKYTTAQQRHADYRILTEWLKQRGLTAVEVAKKTFDQWAYLKKNFYDLGKTPPPQHVGVPYPDQNARWSELLGKYGITDGAMQAEVRGAYSKFSRGYNFTLDQINDTMKVVDSGATQFFDNFLREYKQSIRVGSDFTDVHNDVINLRSEAEKIIDPTERAATITALDEVIEYTYSETELSTTETDSSFRDMFLGPDELSLHSAEDMHAYIASEMRRVNNPDPLFDPTYIEAEEARIAAFEPLFPDDPIFNMPKTTPPAGPRPFEDDFRLPTVPEKVPFSIDDFQFQQHVRGEKFVGEEILRNMIWENPGASYEDMLVEFQRGAIMEGETVTEYSMRVYSRPPEEAFKHVYDIWDQEVDLKQAMRRVMKSFPESKTASRLMSRVQDSRQPPIKHNSRMAEYFDDNRMRLVNDLVEDGTGWVDFKEERARLINLMDKDSTEWEAGKNSDFGLVNDIEDSATWEDPDADEEDFVDADDGKAAEPKDSFETDVGPEEFRSAIEPEPMKITDLEVPGFEDTISIIGLDPKEYIENKAFVDEFMKTAVKDESFMSGFMSSGKGKIAMGVGGLAAGLVVGMGVNALLHNTTQTFLLSLFGAVTGDALAVWGMGMIYYGSLRDWERRSNKISKRGNTVGSEHKQPGQIMYVRGANNKWIPAILQSDVEPRAFDNPVDLAGETLKWSGAHKLVYQTGYGLTMKDGKLAWLQPGTVSQLYAHSDDMNAGNQEKWKPWLQYFIPKTRERDADGEAYNAGEPLGQKDYMKDGMLTSIDAIPYDKIFEDLGSSDGFKSMVEIINFSHMHQHQMHKYSATGTLGNMTEGKDHYSGITDPDFKTTWQSDLFKSTRDHPETFTEGYEWKGWEDADVASMLSWWFESSNPDNWWQRQSKWRKAHDSRDYVTGVTKDFVQDIQKRYAALSDHTKRELNHEEVEQIPTSAAELSTRMLQIERSRILSEEAKEFRLAQEQARFFSRHSYRLDYSSGFKTEFSDMLGKDLLNSYKQSTYDFAQLHPEEFIYQEFRQDDGSRSFAVMFGKTASTFSTRSHSALGYWSLPPIRKMPKITRTSRAFIHAHNLSVPPRIGGPLKKENMVVAGADFSIMGKDDPLAVKIAAAIATALAATKAATKAKEDRDAAAAAAAADTQKEDAVGARWAEERAKAAARAIDPIYDEGSLGR